MIRKTLIAIAIAAGMLAGPSTALAYAETPVAPIASADANNAAMQAFSAKVGVATTVGGLLGTGIGFATGCVIGGLVTSQTVVFVPVGCLTVGVTGAALGGVVGTLVVGGPTAVIAGVEMVQVLVTPA